MNSAPEKPFKIVAVTNRGLCEESLAARVERLCLAGFDRVVVREKDLSETQFSNLLHEILKKLSPEQRNLITVNTFASVARKAGISSVQLSFSDTLELAASDKLKTFEEVGVSIHSVEEARAAEELGAHYLIAGHIFETGCKPGVTSRGLNFLHEVCAAVSLPVYAIGGISADNIDQVQKAGAAGACLMSFAMTCPNPQKFISMWTHYENL